MNQLEYDNNSHYYLPLGHIPNSGLVDKHDRAMMLVYWEGSAGDVGDEPWCGCRDVQVVDAIVER